MLALEVLKGGLSKSLKGLIIFALVLAVGFVVYNLYILPMLMDAVHSVYVNPMEFRIQSFDFDTFLAEEETEDYVYRSIPSNPFMPLDPLITVVEEPQEEIVAEKKVIEYLLRGIVSGYQKNLAIVEGAGMSFILREGDSFQDLQVVEIGRESVLLRDDVWSVYKLLLGGGYGESI